MIDPSAINVITIGLSMIIFAFFWRMLAARMADSPTGQAMAVIL